MYPRISRALLVLIAFGTAAGYLTVGLSRGRACSLCSNMGKTFADSIAEADTVLFGTLSHAVLDDRARPGETEGSTKFELRRVIKAHGSIAGKTVLTLPRYLPDARAGTMECVVFAEIVGGRVDPYRAIPVETNRLVDYLVDVVRLSAAPARERFTYLFQRLDDDDPSISGDAYKEFANAPNADILSAANTFDPDRLRGWIENPRTPSQRIGLYACLIGMHGRKSDAGFLERLIRVPSRRPPQGMDAVLAGYCLLDPENGPALALRMLGDPANDFALRYAALRAIRFLLTDTPALDREALLGGMLAAVEHADMADLIIDELRKQRFWTPTERILALDGKPELASIVIRRAIVRFALQSPDPVARDFIGQLRSSQPRLVEDAEELLRFESEPAKPASPSRSTSSVGAGS